MPWINSLARRNPYFKFFASSDNTTQIVDSIRLSPTFATLWLGINNIINDTLFLEVTSEIRNFFDEDKLKTLESELNKVPKNYYAKMREILADLVKKGGIQKGGYRQSH